MNARVLKLQGLTVLPLCQELHQVAQVVDLPVSVYQQQDQRKRLLYPAFILYASTCNSMMTCWSPLCCSCRYCQNPLSCAGGRPDSFAASARERHGDTAAVDQVLGRRDCLSPPSLPHITRCCEFASAAQRFARLPCHTTSRVPLSSPVAIAPDASPLPTFLPPITSLQSPPADENRLVKRKRAQYIVSPLTHPWMSLKGVHMS